jgi:predicted Holliday junction resolvase-like endonuclease
MSWLDVILIVEAILLVYMAKEMNALKEQVVSENHTLADDLSRLNARVAKQRDRMLQLTNGRL